MTRIAELDQLFRMFLSQEWRKRDMRQRHALHCILADRLEELGDVDAAQALRKGQFSVVERACDGITVIIPFLQGPLGRDVHHLWSWCVGNVSKLEGAVEGRDYIKGQALVSDTEGLSITAETALTPDGSDYYT